MAARGLRACRLARLTLLLILIHLGVASATALTSAALPINAPQNRVCLGTETFTSKQFTRIGLWLKGIAHVLLLLVVAAGFCPDRVEMPRLRLSTSLRRSTGDDIKNKAKITIFPFINN